MASLGVESYRVGGSVRDELLGRPSKDADYMVRGTALRPLGELLKLALRDGRYPKPSVKPLVLRDGRQAGWRVSAKGLGCIEIVLPRYEQPRTPRKGENVHRAFDITIDPNVSLAGDSMRRDFTFNALYMRVEDIAGVALARDIHDPTGRGLYDLERKLVATTHEHSFRDDPLRTLRALRFVSVLGYDLCTDTQRQMETYAAAVTGLSAKGYASGTVVDELSRMLMGPDAVKALRLARDTGVLAQILPELAPMIGFDQGSRYHDLTTDEHTFKALETATKVDAPLRVRWALLFHDSGKPESAWTGKDGRKHYYAQKDGSTEDHEVAGERIWRRAAGRLGMDRPLREDVAKIIRHHMVPIKVRNPGGRARRMRVQFGDDMLQDLLMHRMCDITGKGVASMPALDAIGTLERERKIAQDSGVPASTKELRVNGHDAMELGLSGRQIGGALNSVLIEVVDQPDALRMGRDWQLERLTTYA